MVFQCINIRQMPWEVLKTAAFGIQHLPRDLANVNAWKTIFDPYIVNADNFQSTGQKSTKRHICFLFFWENKAWHFMRIVCFACFLGEKQFDGM